MQLYVHFFGKIIFQVMLHCLRLF